MIPYMIVILALYLLLLLSYPQYATSFKTKSHGSTLLTHRHLSLVNRDRNALQDNVRTASVTLRSTTLVDEIDQSTSRASLKDLIRTPLHQDRTGIVIIAGFEAFNVQLYRKAAALVMWVKHRSMWWVINCHYDWWIMIPSTDGSQFEPLLSESAVIIASVRRNEWDILQ